MSDPLMNTIETEQRARALEPEREKAIRFGRAMPAWAVFKRELRVYFRSPIAYAIAFALFFFVGWLFNAYIAQSNGQYPADATYVPSLITFLLFLIAPLITMRLFAEEAREGTIEVLMTLPMGSSQIVLGKFFAAWCYYTVLLQISLIYVLLLALVGVPDLGAAVGAYAGAWLYGGAALAISLVWSAITEDQIVAAFLSAATLLVMYLADIAAGALAGQGNVPWLAEFVRELGFRSHYDATMAVGIIRVQDILYFIILMVISLFATTLILESRRWRS
ncbi:MAG TPA: ABC transporter permease [Candidatus Limnocylindrales bacterium]|nr:ABC transporter permease [Candidatus Limnocylindrales bacterium]